MAIRGALVSEVQELTGDPGGSVRGLLRAGRVGSGVWLAASFEGGVHPFCGRLPIFD
jgi:hypothetical protein